MLTRAQLLMGNSSQGVVLAGQTQGVRQGVGVIIAADGTISFDSTTATGVLKTNNPTAYNAYVWPTTLGAVGQQLQLGAAGALSWEDPDQIPWTAKGQLIVGTGLNTSTILSVGVDGSVLIADSTQTSGLGYTTNFVATTSATGAANIPAGATGLRPVTPPTGAFRYNSTTTSLEFYNGSGWETVASSSTNSFVEQTSTTGAAVMPAGTQLQRPGGPAGGFFRFDDDTDHMEFWNGTSWQEVASGNSPTPPVPATIVSSVTGTLPITVATGTSTPVIAINAATTALPGSVQLADAAASQGGTSATLASTPAFSVPKDASGMTGAALISGGNNAARPGTPVTGMLRYNSQTLPAFMEFWDSAAWTAVGAPPVEGLGIDISVVGTIVKVSIPVVSTPPAVGAGAAQAIDGSFYWDNTLGQIFIRYNDGTTTQWVAAAPPAGGVPAASSAEAAAGLITTKYSSPATAVAKDAAGTTGAAILPGGTQVQRPGTPAAGMIRYNTDTYGSDTVYEAYDPVIPGWRPLQYGVSLGVLPSYTATNGATLPASGTYENITIPAGVTVYVDGLSSLRARSSIVVDGTLVGTGRGYVGGQGGNTFQVGGPSDYLATVGVPGAGAGRGQGNGGLANAGIVYGFNLLLGSSGGSGAITTFGASGVPASGGGAGGAGGASITFVCDRTITVGASAIISMNGGAAAAPVASNNAQVGGGGGGSGGLILLQAAQSLTLGAALLDVSGGSGGVGAAAGVSITGHLGGGGGGGGYVVLNSPNLTNAATINLNGGSAGPLAGVANYADGGGGGGFGGAGGAGGQNLGGGPFNAATAGSNGQTLLNAYI